MQTFGIIFFLLAGIVISWQGALQDWTFEVLRFDINNSNPEIMELNMTSYLKSRTDYAFPFIMDIKEPLTNELFVEIQLERSATGSSDYKLEPLVYSRGNLAYFMNGPYKEAMMPFLKDCATNTPVFDVFVAPLTPRRIEGKDCKMPNDFLPVHVRKGYYRTTVKISGQNDLVVEIYSIVENLYD